MSDSSMVESLLFAALEKRTAAERTAFLASACAGNSELRRRVEKLLRAHANAGDFLQKPVGEQLAGSLASGDATEEIGASTDGPAAAPDGGTALYLERAEGGTASGPDSTRGFLQPSTRSDSLGRLGHYEVLEVLGQGGFGIVFRAVDEQLQRIVAIKVLSPEMAATSPARRRFLREARSSARVRHENVVQVYAVEEEPLPYLVMEFVPGETLQQRLDRSGPLEATEVVELGRQIAEGLAAAHAQGLIHRDIKPGNILIEAGSRRHARITDFGLARAADDASLSQSGVVAGTPMFMAPEQASAGTLDHRADLFSLGSVLYTMASGRPPFRAPSTLAVLKRVVEDTPRPIREIIPEVPQWLCDIISRLHAKNPDDRLSTAQEAADLLAHGEAKVRRPGTLPPQQVEKPGLCPRDVPQPAPVRKRAGRWAAAVAVLLLGVLGIMEATGVTNMRGMVSRLFSPEKASDAEAKKDDPEAISAVTPSGGARIRSGETEKDVGANSKNADRRVAEYVLSIGGKVKVNDQDEEIKAASDLPRESFRLTFVELARNKQVTDAGLAVFKDCKSLTGLSLWQTNVGDEGLVHVKECKAVTHLWLGTTRVTDAGLAQLAGRTNLVLVDLLSTNVTDVGLANLKNCRELDNLSLFGTGVTDAGLDHLKDCRNLTSLYLGATKVTDAGLPRLAGMDRLMYVGLKRTQVSAQGVASLAKSAPQCIIDWDGGRIQPTVRIDPERRAAEYVLSIGGTVRLTGEDRDIRAAADLPGAAFQVAVVGLINNRQLTDAGLAFLKDCKSLTIADLVGTPVTDASMMRLKDCKNLTALYMAYTDVGDDGLTQLRSCKNLTELNLHHTRVTNAGLAVAREWKTLKVLNLAELTVTDAGLLALKECKSLTGLYLNDTQVTDAGLAHLTGLDQLTRLTLLKTQVTAQGVEKLARALPRCKIEWDGGVIEPK
jgi:serine/threonine protein kinase